VFRDDAQAARALRALLATAGLDDLWSDKGPNQSAVALKREGRRSLSPAQDVLFHAAWSLWDRAAPAAVRFDEIVRHLHRPACDALFSLVMAYIDGAAAVDAWIVDTAPRHRLNGGARGSEPPIPGGTGGVGGASLDEMAGDWPTLDELSLRYIRRVVDRQQGNQARVAAVLGVDPRTVTRVLTKVRSGRVPSMQTRR
jgi:hypothetical protein